MKKKTTLETQCLIVAGHPRSGTTILNRFLNSHPRIMTAFEFRAFFNMDEPHDLYLKGLRNNWVERRLINKSIPPLPDTDKKALSRLFYEAFTEAIAEFKQENIGFSHVRSAFQRALPGIPIVGDKVPAYIFLFNRLGPLPELKRVVIYRDCRAVVRSALEMSRTKWFGKGNAVRYGTVEKIANSWVKAVALMEKYRDRSHVIRYEDFVANPAGEASRLGAYLGVSPNDFVTRMMKTDRVKKYVDQLSKDDLEIIETIAGPAMRRWGYL